MTLTSIVGCTLLTTTNRNRCLAFMQKQSSGREFHGDACRSEVLATVEKFPPIGVNWALMERVARKPGVHSSL